MTASRALSFLISFMKFTLEIDQGLLSVLNCFLEVLSL